MQCRNISIQLFALISFFISLGIVKLCDLQSRCMCINFLSLETGVCAKLLTSKEIWSF